jgi:hypothetical protein
MDNQGYVLLSEIRDLMRESVELQKKIVAHHQWEAKMIQESLGSNGVPSLAVHECPSTCENCSC